MMTIDITNMCSHLQKKLFEKDGEYHSLWMAMKVEPELTAVVRSRQLHIYPRYTIAFGDGGNDSSMIKKAGIGVAMGNALDSLKLEADYTTTSVDDDGVLNALRHFNLL